MHAYVVFWLQAFCTGVNMATLSRTSTAQDGQLLLSSHPSSTSSVSSAIAASPVTAVYQQVLDRPAPSLMAHSKRVISSSEPIPLEKQRIFEAISYHWTSLLAVQPLANIFEWASLLFSRTKIGDYGHDEAQEYRNYSRPVSWTTATSNSTCRSHNDKLLRDVPGYVFEHAPLIHLYSKEKFWPGDITEHLRHVSVYVNYFRLGTENEHRNVTNLDGLNLYGLPLYLTSDDDVSYRPTWLQGAVNIPLEPGSKKGPAGRSKAPVSLIVVDKGGGVIDAFWFFFYSFNLGNEVLGLRYGNHVGDWEHTIVRFQDGKPSQVFFSEHTSGRAFTFEAVEKIGKRPVGYSASGTHAMYSTAAVHRYILPWGLLQDVTDRGPLWDPVLNMYAYTYELSTNTLCASNTTPEAPTSWFYFDGRWGDKRYKLEDTRQYKHLQNYHYVDGPQGPLFKDLDRSDICSGHVGCKVQDSLDGEGTLRFVGWERASRGPADVLVRLTWLCNFGFAFLCDLVRRLI